jgi:hypothetical protein
MDVTRDLVRSVGTGDGETDSLDSRVVFMIA